MAGIIPQGCGQTQEADAGRRGNSRGTIDKTHYQDHEILLRHLYDTVRGKVATFEAETGADLQAPAYRATA